MIEVYEKIIETVIAGNVEELKKLTQRAIDEGFQGSEILEKGLIPGMDVVGQRMGKGEMFIPEVLLSAKTMQAGMEVLQPFLSERDTAGAGTVVIGTVEGDLHDIGKNLVAMMLAGAGFKVIDLGIDVKVQTFVEAGRTNKANIVAMSALLTTTMPRMEEVMKSLKEAGIRDNLKVMVGGAPVTQDFVDRIGADAYGANAGEAVQKAKKMMA